MHRKAEMSITPTPVGKYIVINLERRVNMKKPVHIFFTALLLSCIAVTSCAENQSNMTTLRIQNSIRYYDSIDECIAEADFIVDCTVSEIGETYLNSDLPTPSDEASVNDYIRAIRTPVVLSINNIYYDSTDLLGNSLTVLEYRGTYNGYTLENNFPTYEEGHEYILFIKQAPDGETNIIMHQGSIDITPESSARSAGDVTFSPMFNEDIFDDIDTAADLIETIEKFK